MATGKEKKHDRLGATISVIIHGLLFLLFFFLLAWQPPDPPIEEYGILVNFGTNDAGSGPVQPKNPPVETKKVEEKVQEEPKPQQKPLEEVVEKQQEVQEKVADPVKEQEPIKEVKEESVKQPEPDPVVEKEEKKPEPKKEVRPRKEAPKTEPVKSTKPTRDTKGTGDIDPAKSNQGNKPKKTGDQGKPQGSIDSKALYGSQKGGNGSSYSLTGWKWDEPPQPDDDSSESGRIVFQITVDSEGEVVSVKTLQSTVTPSVRRKYEDAVYELTFSKTAENTRAAVESVGTVTFIIKSN